MTATATESANFFWHCMVAALLIDTLPESTARSAHTNRAVRMATYTTVGKKGVFYASNEARKIKESSGEDWYNCGLIREHVIPASLIHERVVRELSLPLTGHNAQTTTGLVPSEMETQWLTKNVAAQFQENQRAWQVAKIVREWTLLAWISEPEHSRLRDRSLHNCMPSDWEGQDKFARYHECNIEYAPIEAIPA